MKNTTTYSLLSWFGFLAILLWMTGCGTRKVSIDQIKKERAFEQQETEQNDAQTVENQNIDWSEAVFQDNETCTEKTTYTPIDSSKESVFIDKNGVKQSLQNTTYSTEKTTSKNKEYNSQKANIIAGKSSNVLNAKTKDTKDLSGEMVKAKETENTSISWWWWLLVIPIGGYAFWKFTEQQFWKY